MQIIPLTVFGLGLIPTKLQLSELDLMRIKNFNEIKRLRGLKRDNLGSESQHKTR